MHIVLPQMKHGVTTVTLLERDNTHAVLDTAIWDGSLVIAALVKPAASMQRVKA